MTESYWRSAAERERDEAYSDLKSVKNALLEVNAPTANSPADQIRALYAVMWDDIVRLAAKCDEARAEVERPKEAVVKSRRAHAAGSDVALGSDARLANATRAAFQRGAEAMREAAAARVQGEADGWMSVNEIICAIRALPVPEDQ